MSILETLRFKSSEMKNQLIIIYYAYHNPKVKLLPKIIVLICIAYALSPIDLIPDFIPVLGYLDDLIIIPALLALAIKLIPEEVMDESRKMAAAHRISLKKNWVFALIFISIWIVIAGAIIKAIISAARWDW